MAKKRLYEILNVAPDASTRDIVKAFRIAALRTHPDKLAGLSESEREKATSSFVQLQHAYEILKDAERRKKYDDFGWEGEEDAAFAAAYEFYKGPISSEDIEDFSKTYKNSAAEEEDLLEFYNKYVRLAAPQPSPSHRHKGDITDVLMYIPLSEASDLERFVKFYESKIASEELKTTSRFTKTSSAASLKQIKLKYKKKMQREAKRSQSSESFEDLTAKIMANRKKREEGFASFLSDMEQKYSAKLNLAYLKCWRLVRLFHPWLQLRVAGRCERLDLRGTHVIPHVHTRRLAKQRRFHRRGFTPNCSLLAETTTKAPRPLVVPKPVKPAKSSAADGHAVSRLAEPTERTCISPNHAGGTRLAERVRRATRLSEAVGGEGRGVERRCLAEAGGTKAASATLRLPEACGGQAAPAVALPEPVRREGPRVEPLR
ncbi:DnaJ protein, putative [Babesia caballi]|uniref:DnaJ protein, putative n=1 Tax=Babesia caballi TaxID=5871 RepID=A0AAV4LW58_BABCB|nr:DnaJ protein, putative [Babesia caballi]